MYESIYGSRTYPSRRYGFSRGCGAEAARSHGGSAIHLRSGSNAACKWTPIRRISSASESSTVKQRILSGPMSDPWTRTRLSQRMAPPTVKQRILSGPISDTWTRTRFSQGGSTHCQKTDPERTHFDTWTRTRLSQRMAPPTYNG
ncbi:unnamed protein product [Arctogadus glacialis]